MTSTHPHIPILCDEIMDRLDIHPHDNVLDVTIGFGGHSSACLEKLSQKGHLYGIDRDQEAIDHVTERFKENKNTTLFQCRFSKIKSLLSDQKLPKIDKIIVDLGISSHQIDHTPRGFSFNHEGPLDMRMNQLDPIPKAATLLNKSSKEELHDIFTTFGEIHNPEKLVTNILLHRKNDTFTTTTQLIEKIKKSFYFKNKRTLFLKTCAQVFQALRIAVNHELDELDELLNQIPTILTENGRIAFLSFHSLEDKKIKYHFKALPGYKMMHKHVIRASQKEFKENSRSKCAKLRVYEFNPSKNVKRQKYPKTSS